MDEHDVLYMKIIPAILVLLLTIAYYLTFLSIKTVSVTMATMYVITLVFLLLGIKCSAKNWKGKDVEVNNLTPEQRKRVKGVYFFFWVIVHINWVMDIKKYPVFIPENILNYYFSISRIIFYF